MNIYINLMQKINIKHILIYINVHNLNNKKIEKKRV